MKKLLATLFACMATALFSPGAIAQERGTREEAKALAEAAANHVKAVGVAKALKDFSTDKANWVKKDLYVVALDLQGHMLAHGTNEKLIGKNVMEMKDANGRFFTKAQIESTKATGAGWADYDFTHPVTKKIEGKSTYSVRPPGTDLVVGVGHYR